ncbi:MAG: TolB family protein [Gemmatimonadaceae bacterium]
MTPRRAAVRFASIAVIAAATLAAACTDSNITGVSHRSGAGDVVLFASNRADDNFEIYRIAGNGEDLRRLTVDRVNNDLAPVVSHDGKRIAWQKEIVAPDGSVTSVEIWVMDIDGRNQHVVVRNAAENLNPSWATGDSVLVYESRAPGNSDIFRVSLASGAARNLTSNPFADQYPRVSPDGAKILFQSNRDLNFDIYVMNLDGSGVRNLTANPADDRFASWTPDGTHVVWSRFTDSFDIFLMAADGTGQHSIVATAFEETNPSVSPDGASVVYQTNRYPRSSLEIAAIDGSGAHALTGSASRPAVSDVAPWWTAAAP